MTPRAYCPYCNDDVTFDTRRFIDTLEVDGVMFSFECKKAFCDKCGAYINYEPYLEAAGVAFQKAVSDCQEAKNG